MARRRRTTASGGTLNVGLGLSAILGAVVPIAATAATGGLASVPTGLWLALGAVVAGLGAGNVPTSADKQTAGGGQ